MATSTNYTFPKWDYTPCFDGVSAESELAYQCTELEKFKKAANDCFSAIARLPDSDYQTKHKKYQELKELRKRICEAKRCSTAFTETGMPSLVDNISQVMRQLKEAFNTTSNLFKFTMHQTHFEKVKPSIDDKQTPELSLKLNINDLDASFISIREQRSAQAKMRALYELIKLIEKEIEKVEKNKPVDSIKINELKLNIKRVEKDGNALLTIDEKIWALKSMHMRDKDKEQHAKLMNHVDATGKDHAFYITKTKQLPLAQKVNYLVQLLKERYESKPVMSKFDYLMTWPKEAIEKNQKETVLELLKLRKFDKTDNKDYELVYDYLFSLYDPTGAIRIKSITELNLSTSEMCLKAASILQSVKRYQGKYPTKLFAQIRAETKPAEMPKSSKSIDSVSGKMSSNDAEWLASLLKNHLVTLLSSHDWDSFEKFEETLKNANDSISKFGEKLRSYIKTKSSKSFLSLALQLAAQGEYTFGLYVYLGLSSLKGLEDKNNKQMAWLGNLFNTERKFANLNKFNRDREEKGVLNAPFMPFVLNGLEGSALFDRCIDAIKDYLAETCKGVSFNESFKIMEKNDYTKIITFFDKNYSGHAIDRDRKVLLEKIKEAVEQQEQPFDFYEKFVAKVRALIIYHRDPSWREMADQTDFIKQIEAFEAP